MPCEFSCRIGSVPSGGFRLRFKNYCFLNFVPFGIFVSAPVSYSILEQTSIEMWNFHDYLQTNSCNFKQNRKFPIEQKNRKYEPNPTATLCYVAVLPIKYGTIFSRITLRLQVFLVLGQLFLILTISTQQLKAVEIFGPVVWEFPNAKMAVHAVYALRLLNLISCILAPALFLSRETETEDPLIR